MISPKSTASLILLFALHIAIVAGDHGTHKNWQPMFADEGFEGWTFDVLNGSDPFAIYQNKEGLLSIMGKDKSNAVVQSIKTYSDFELKFEWRWLEEEGGNSGCLIYSSTPRFLNVWPKSLEVQMYRGNAGDFIYIGETIDVPDTQRLKDLPPDSWKHRLRFNLTDGSENPIGEWNQAHIVAKNGTVTVTINDELVNRGWNVSTDSGSICFQAEGSNVVYRNIMILEK